ncbi:Hypothetical protein A7982_08112 [Minicystis rosea]|nr:Hypothetical protein A7982_08112 [Minicystis rosea]
MAAGNGSSMVTGEWVMPHLSAVEHAARGKAERAEISRASHAAWGALPGRADPIALLEEQAKTRVPELVPIRYGRMLVSPFAFYRGAACVMASDLAAAARSGLRVQLCGDAHLSNFGVFGSPERRMMFDINDFDETLPGPWDWDVKRLAASVELAGRDTGFSKSTRADIVLTTVREYRLAMRRFAALRNLDVWYASLDVEQIFEQFRTQVGLKRVNVAERHVAKARTKDSFQAYEKLTHEVGGRRRIISDPPLIVPMDEFVKGGPATSSKSRCATSCVATAPPSRPIDGTCSRDMTSRTWPTRSSVSGASARAPGSSCSSAATSRTRSSCRRRKRVRRSSSRSSARARTPTAASAWWRASGSCRPRATSSSAGSG